MGKVPSLTYIKVCGCEAYVCHEAREKLEPRSQKCYFVVYGNGSFGYYF